MPNYRERRLSPYDDLADLGRDEESDPYRYGASLIAQIQARARQEIATHTFSHFYCLEEGGDLEAFRADLRQKGRRTARDQAFKHRFSTQPNFAGSSEGLPRIGPDVLSR
jgi:hypothetical protein